MIIKTFDAFTRLSTNDINRITNFLFEYSEESRNTKSAIRKSVLYAAKEISGLGGYVFVIEQQATIIGVAVVNRTGMNEYLSDNLLVYLAVKNEFRGKGIAKALINHTKTYCNGDISVHISKDNSAIKLFKNEGFKSRNIEMRLVRD